ncbi:Tail Collar domain protein [Paracidovorax avenae ATCC 19860]|uniref:Tail Collar domain protein n=1 Tax=Paracidovorax avenae (strain ATCC 19860 / DSM 7227 / CCUG 15838 / JCM 20985 / LMG 2117 / NCPPB 1011) TaxID=643561 RepID=F0Q921_PARA1|nr:tail fiber protein [Paracidovorax avenae]ADX47151.1 Tail Collar domain protein [Paracidovorax avenae ATCC 19860]AVS66664.1 phage tail protein [Paracidovorax avenae]
MALDPFIGEISIFAGNYPPKGWAFCQGQILSIAQNSALFALLGTTYGGNGVTTFALPDLRGRIPLGPGQGLGSPTNYMQGQVGGQETVTLLSNQMPAHVHTASVAVSSSQGNSPAPNGRYLAASDQRNDQYTDQGPDGTLAGVTTNVAGSSMPHENMPPYLCLNFIIALQGVFPSRN